VLLIVALGVGALTILSGAGTQRGEPLPSPGPVIWSADAETGDLSQWTVGQEGESVFNTGTGVVDVSTDVAHGGDHSYRLTIDGASGRTEAARVFRWAEDAQAAYYSVWFYIPRVYHPAQWWSIFQFKSVTARSAPASDPMWMVDINNRPDGSMYLYLWDAIDRTSFVPREHVNLPVGRWFQLTAYFRRANDRSGRIALWQDGTLLYDIDGIETVTGANVHWGICNYSDDIDPPDVTIYADDAEIRGAPPGE